MEDLSEEKLRSIWDRAQPPVIKAEVCINKGQREQQMEAEIEGLRSELQALISRFEPVISYLN